MNTICPDCNASFNVTEQQLSVAKGKVRCGSCLHVFNAIDHIDEEIIPPVLTSEHPNPEMGIQNISAEEDEAWALKLIQDEGESVSASTDESTANNTAAKKNPAASPTPAPKPSKASPKQTSGNIQTELTAAPKFNPQSNQIDSEGFSDGFQALKDFDEDSPISFFGSKEDAALLAGDEASTDHWAEEMLKELEQEPDSDALSPKSEIEGALDELGFNSDPPEFLLDEDGFSSMNDPMSDDPLGLGTLEQEFSFETEHQDDLIDPQMLISNINVEPVELSLERVSDRRLKRNALHFFSVLVAAMALTGQYAYFQFDHLARTAQLRPYYEKVCAIIHCQLPTLQNVKQIRGSNLIIRSHPSYLNALIVDAIISNRASYAQIFPLLELTFSDINDVVVASRTFTPDEYLKGELLNLASMPARAPIHITLEIVDPGATAVNYALQFHSSNPRGESTL